ncbi:hypothetical protein GP5015_1591 [gamma proteobacterium HTCC5015]|nr:hypothetical protein GP5015_1591 [gamma proteobacterium HTCC5015]
MKGQKTTSRKHIMVTVPPELGEKIEKIAQKEDRSIASVCRRYIQNGVEKAELIAQ